jgi:hypothetical protein
MKEGRPVDAEPAIKLHHGDRWFDPLLRCFGLDRTPVKTEGEVPDDEESVDGLKEGGSTTPPTVHIRKDIDVTTLVKKAQPQKFTKSIGIVSPFDIAREAVS